MRKKYNGLNHLFNFLSVILGVYLAFYINERAKISQDRKEGAILMNSLMNDLSEDIRLYENFEIPENIRIQGNVDSMISLISSKNIKAIEGQLLNILEVENFAPTTSTYSSMKLSGKLGLIEDLTLQKQIADFYEGLALESTKKGEYQADYFTDEIMAWLTLNADLLNMEILNQNELVVFRNKLIIYTSLISQKVNSYQWVVENSKKLKLQIEQFLNT